MKREVPPPSEPTPTIPILGGSLPRVSSRRPPPLPVSSAGRPPEQSNALIPVVVGLVLVLTLLLGIAIGHMVPR